MEGRGSGDIADIQSCELEASTPKSPQNLMTGAAFERHTHTLKAPGGARCREAVVIRCRGFSFPAPLGEVDGMLIKLDGGGGVLEVHIYNGYPETGSGWGAGDWEISQFSIARSRGEELENIAESNRRGRVRIADPHLESTVNVEGPGAGDCALLRIFVRQLTRRGR